MSDPDLHNARCKCGHRIRVHESDVGCNLCYHCRLDWADALLSSSALVQMKAEALREAADIQALHPGEVKNSVIWLRDRADSQAKPDSHEWVGMER